MKFLVSWIRSIYKNIGINKIVKTQEDAVNMARNGNLKNQDYEGQ